METLRGIPVSPGVAIGRVFALDDVRRRIPRRKVSEKQSRAELSRFEDALATSIAELQSQRERTAMELGDEAAKIFAFHLGMLSDPNLIEPIRARITDERVTAEYAVSQQFKELAERFQNMGDAAFATKVDDVWDLDRRLLGRLIGEHRGRMDALTEAGVVIAPELTPSQTAGFDRSKVRGFATDTGGRTSHTAILARALGIPAVVGLERLSLKAADGDPVIVDGDKGVVILHPDDETIAQYEAYSLRMQEFRRSLDEAVELPAQTLDGVRVHVYGNIEFPDEAAKVVALGGDGVGLFRSEFLHLRAGRQPTEDEHFEAYREAVEALGGRPLTIRTLDLGSDKQAQGAPERNPALGRRSIRQSLQEIATFRVQLRAALRASALGPVRIMFPLVTNVLEQRQARMIVEDVKEDLADDGVPFDAKTPIGMMMETPAAALMATTFAKEVDFFSIGTNDLVQYTLAVDRTNEHVASLYSAAHPAVLRLIKEIVRAGSRRDLPVSICGEAAGDIEYTMLLIGLGLRSLSVTPSLIPTVKRVIRSVDVTMCERVARKVGSFDSERQVSAYMRDQTRAIIPEVFGGRPAE